MMRILRNLNIADAREECEKLGISSEEKGLLDKLIQYGGIKLSVAGEVASGMQQTFTQWEDITLVTSDTSGEEVEVLLIPHCDVLEFLSSDSLRHLERISPEVYQLLQESRKRFLEESWEYRIPGGTLKIRKPLLMGIVNTTPDSFSDGGQFNSPERAYQHAMSLLEGGANIIDIGGESTRPGASPVPLEEEWQRVGPVIQRLAKVKDCIISIDTVKSEIARRALEEGAHIINDISALRFDENMVNVAHHYAVPVILMHMQGMPQTMQKNPTYTHLMEEIITFFQKQIDYAGGHGVTQLIIDPGIGFGKRVEDNYELIRRIAEFRVFGYPILLGTSRKSFIGKLSGNLPRDRIGGTIAANLYAYQKGVQMFRVHDVKELKEALQVFQGIQDLKAS